METTKKKKYARSSLVIPKVKVTSPSVFFTIENTKKVPNGAACMSSIIGSHGSSKKELKIDVRVFVLNTHGVTTEHVKKWAAFITRCGFKCYFEEPEENSTAVGILFFKREDYVNTTHYKIGLTVGRYIGYHISKFNELPNIITSLYEKFPCIDAYQALILSHYGHSNGLYFDGGHGLVDFKNGCPIPLTKEQFLERIKKNDNYIVTKDCTEYDKKLLPASLIEKAKAGNWEELIKLLIEK